MIYAIGDIHGALGKLLAAHERIEADRAAHGGDGAAVVHIGDLVDRGPDSAGVIDHLIARAERGERDIVLKGNHDRMFLLFMTERGGRDPRLRLEFSWLGENLGGRATLASYGVGEAAMDDPDTALAEAMDRVPPAHLDLLASLPVSHETEDIFFAHAGIRPGLPLDEQEEDDLVWIRDEFLDSILPHPKLIVHGHTPVERVSHMGNRVAIDTGAAYGGPLSAVVFDEGMVFELTDSGRVPVPPMAI